MKKVTKKDLIEFMKSQAEMSIEIMKLVSMNKQSIIKLENKKESSQEQADYDELIAILDKKEPKLKQLDQSIFNGLDEKWRFAARCLSGKAIATKSEPRIILNGYYCEGGYLLIGEGYDTTNWQNSLIERETVELTGSDLCRAMLERGDKFVMCLVSDMSHAGAISNCSKPRLIVNHEVMGFIEEPKDLYWHFAVPINNQGEPLTQSEAGL